jgi:hypothetical protein
MNTPSDHDFAELQRLLRLKRHEQPPPGYFEALPRQVMASLRKQPRAQAGEGTEGVPAWILSFLERIQAQPAFAGLVGAGLCILLLGAVVFYEKDAKGPQPMPSVLAEITRAESQVPGQAVTPVAFQPVTAEAMTPMMASNQWQAQPGSSLFDMTPGLQTAPVAHRP